MQAKREAILHQKCTIPEIFQICPKAGRGNETEPVHEVPCRYLKYKVSSGDHTPNPWRPRKNDQLVLLCLFVIPVQAGIQVGTHD